MQGTRLPDAEMGIPGPGWDAWGQNEVIAPAGAYMKILLDGHVYCWYARAPNGDVCSIGHEVHAIGEHPDGTITVSPSIVFPHGGKWHGFLRRGVWS